MELSVVHQRAHTTDLSTCSERQLSVILKDKIVCGPETWSSPRFWMRTAHNPDKYNYPWGWMMEQTMVLNGKCQWSWWIELSAGMNNGTVHGSEWELLIILINITICGHERWNSPWLFIFCNVRNISIKQIKRMLNAWANTSRNILQWASTTLP